MEHSAEKTLPHTGTAWSARLAEENARVFGSAPLRPEQEQAVNAALDNRLG